MRGALLLGLTACFAPKAPAGVPCSSDLECPGEQRCNQEVSPPTCGVETPPPADAAIDAPLGPWGPPRLVMVPVGDEDDPTLTDDMLEMHFNRDTLETFRVRRPSVDDAWGAPEPMPELDPSTTPEISGDGLTMYIATDRVGGLGGNDIWISTRATRDAAWGAPQHVPDLSSAATDTNATVSADGSTVVFVRRTGAATVADVYLATREAAGDAWGTATAIAELTSAQADGDPMLARDGLEIYFYSTRTRMGDLYVARRDRVGDPFRAPEPIDELNSDALDQDPWISPDRRRLVFSSNRGGSLAIYESTR